MKILNIQRMSTEDGPGLRTTVFFKGCPLKCAWCHNPESICPLLQKEWFQIRCIGCHICIANCPNSALSIAEKRIITDSSKCALCLKCVDGCPTGAMQQLGKSISADELYSEVIKDKAYFNGEGGVTLSGGEVMAQTTEAVIMCQKLKAKGISIAIDTSGFTQYGNFRAILPYIDLILYDLKIDSALEHQRLCGVDNTIIKNNLIELSKESVEIWIRTPIIPQATDSIENIKAIATFLENNAIRFNRWELCAFNNLCVDKYSRLEQSWQYKNVPLIPKQVMEKLLAAAQAIISQPQKVSFTGLTRLEEEQKCTKQ
ncbi:MAG: glycyl-radical enzyme activating protein [Candidatus Izemoplasmatales bacterium]|jgi:pyruvate formate lyase activating enzyme|nr:glycyl-radical enzyme activating protein [Candidatus Izemoplasmatales bacterium]